LKSRKGIFYDLNVSEYRATINNITYVFSSELHRIKFLEKLNSNRNEINNKLTKRFGIDIENNILADLVLYKNVETRGYLIISGTGEKLCKDLVKLDGNKVMKKN
jgi:hypothetical protein